MPPSAAGSPRRSPRSTPCCATWSPSSPSGSRRSRSGAPCCCAGAWRRGSGSGKGFRSPETAGTGKMTPKSRFFVLLAALALLTLLAWLPTFGNGFVNLDDGLYVTGNPWVLRGLTREGLAWALTANVANNWHPLTLLSHMLDVQLF